MALLWFDGFDYATSINDIATQYPSPGGTGNFAGNAAGRRSGKAISAAVTATVLTKWLPGTSGATAVVGVAVFKSSSAASASGSPAIAIQDAAGTQVAVGYNSDGSLTVYRGNVGGTALGSTAAAVWSTSGFFYLELKVLISATVGTIDLHVNGTSVLSLTGQNTKGSTTTGWTFVLVGAPGSTILDDLYICDGSGSTQNDLLGDCRVDLQMPTAAGSNNGSTPSTGTDRSATIDEIPPNSDTDFNTITNVGDKDTVQIAHLVNAGATPFGVKVSAYAKKTDAGVGKLAPVIRISGTDHDGTDVGQNVTYGYQVAQVYGGTDPTGAAWTEATFNAMEVGYKRTA